MKEVKIDTINNQYSCTPLRYKTPTGPLLIKMTLMNLKNVI
jgi:hypothetical protein